MEKQILTPEQFEQAKEAFAYKYAEPQIIWNDGDVSIYPDEEKIASLLSDLNSLLEQHKEVMEFDHLTNEAIKLDDLFDKMNCLIGYLERWRDTPQGRPPNELNSVINEALDWLKNVKK